MTDPSPLKDIPIKKLLLNFKAERDTEILRSVKTLEMINGQKVAEFWKEVEARQQDQQGGESWDHADRLVNRLPAIEDEKSRSSRADVEGKTLKLLRRSTPLQLNYTEGANGGGVALLWSSPFDSKQVIPAKYLRSVTPGGYTMENPRYTGR